MKHVKQQSNIDGEPLTARTVVATTLLGCHPPRLATPTLVRIGTLFGIPAGTLRVALSRMTAAGELEAVDGGYRLTGDLLRRQARQEEGWHPAMKRWDGGWNVAVVTVDRRPAAERAELRRAAGSLRMAALREGVWLRPNNLPARRLPDALSIVDAQCQWLESRPAGGRRGSRDLAARLWDVDGWSREASRLRRTMARSIDAIEAGDPDALRGGSATTIAVMRHLMHDPLLPPELLPSRWPGKALRREYDRFESGLRRLLEKCVRTVPRATR